MIGKHTNTQLIIGKTFMQRSFHGNKADVIATILKDGTDSLSLLITVTTYIKSITFLLILLEGSSN